MHSLGLLGIMQHCLNSYFFSLEQIIKRTHEIEIKKKHIAIIETYGSIHFFTHWNKFKEGKMYYFDSVNIECNINTTSVNTVPNNFKEI